MGKIKPRKPRYSKPQPIEVASPNFTVTLTLSGDQREYIGKGATMREALETMPRPAKLMAKAFINATDGKRKATLWMMPNRLRLFMRPIGLWLQAVRLERLLR